MADPPPHPKYVCHVCIAEPHQLLAPEVGGSESRMYVPDLNSLLWNCEHDAIILPYSRSAV